MGKGVSVQDLISIIVPVYNTEKYLDQCIQSVLAQTYTNWELLLIDDGSTDSSGAICDKYAAEDNRIKVVHKPNTGVSDSKNKALDLAQGEYIMFLDSDDYWCMENCLEQLITTSQQFNADIVRGEYKAVNQVGGLIFERPLDSKKQKFTNRLLTTYQFLTETLRGEFFVVLSLFRRNAITNIRFSQQIFLEDMDFYANLCRKEELRCIYTPQRFYAYRKHGNAVSNQTSMRKLADSFAMCYKFHEYSQDITDIKLKDYYQYYSVMMYYWTLDTVSVSGYNIQQTIDTLSLNGLKKDINQWIKKSESKFPVIIKTSPYITVYFFKFRHILGSMVRRFLKKH